MIQIMKVTYDNESNYESYYAEWWYDSWHILIFVDDTDFDDEMLKSKLDWLIYNMIFVNKKKWLSGWTLQTSGFLHKLGKLTFTIMIM